MWRVLSFSNKGEGRGGRNFVAAPRPCPRLTTDTLQVKQEESLSRMIRTKNVMNHGYRLDVTINFPN